MLSESELKKELANGVFRNIYLIFGEEKLLVKHTADLLMKKLGVSELSDFNYHSFPSDTDISDISVAADIVPFMGGKNIVRVNDYPIDELTKDDLDTMLKLLGRLPETTVIVFVMPTLELTSKSAKANTSKLISYIDKNGACVELNRRSDMQTERTVVSWAKSGGCEIRGETADYLVRYVGNDLNILNSEMKKLCAYADGKEITREMIEGLCSKNTDAKIYELFDCVISGNTDKALEILRTLFYQRVDTIYVCAVLAGAYVDAYRLRVGAESGLSAKGTFSELNIKKPEWALKKTSRMISRVTTSSLRKSLDEITDTYTKLISVNVNAPIEIEKLLCKLSSISQDRADE